MTDLPDSTRWQLWIVAFGFFMQSLDTTIVNTALPSMAQSLGESPLHMHMVIVSYVLTVAVMLPASGWLADKVGVRNIFFTAIVLFTLGSLFCALSGTLNELLLARALQGVGGAMMVPVGRLTVMKIVPREQYMAAMTFVTLPGQVGPLLGPALGGLLVEYASWHWIFLINIPVGIIGAIATLMLMPNYTMQTRRFDLSGFLLLAVGMAVLTLALDGSKGTGLSPLAIAGLVAVGVVALVLYLLHAQNNNRALFSLKLFRTRTFSLGLAGSFAGRIGSGMLPFMTPVFLQIGLGFSPFHAGLMMIPMVLGSMGMKRIVVQVVNRFGYRRVLVATTLGCCWDFLVRSMSASTAAPHKPSLCTPGLAWRLSSPFRRSSLPECRTIRIKMWLFHGEKGARNEVLATRYYRQTVSGDFRHLHCLIDHDALGGTYQF